MSTQDILLIILAGIIALLLALFQYKYKIKSALKDNALFVFLRFFTFFSVFLLLINPKFEQNSTYTEKPNLVIVADNSASISHLKQNEKEFEFISQLKENQKINDKFNVEYFTFGNQLNTSDSLNFKDQQTNLNKVFRDLSEIYKNTTAPTLLISDGNQTIGSDYQFSANNYKQPIYPIILGDTITYADLKISQLNVNKYAYLKNRFPVEAIIVYNGNETVTKNFTITQNGKAVYSKTITFSKDKWSQIINTTLPASSVGVESYQAQIVPISTEKNKINNFDSG